MKKEKQKTREEELEREVRKRIKEDIKSKLNPLYSISTGSWYANKEMIDDVTEIMIAENLIGFDKGKQSALNQFEDEVKDKVEKLKEVISNVMAVGDYSTWAGLEEQTLKEVDKIFGDEETSKEMGE